MINRNPKFVIAVVLVAIVVVAVAFLRFKSQRAVKRADVSSVVVLPSKVSASPDLSYLTDAVPGTLSTLLAQVPYLEIRHAPASVEVERFQGNLQHIAELYGVQSFI